MNAKHLILTLTLILAAGAALAALSRGAADPISSAPSPECDVQASAPAIPRVAVTGAQTDMDIVPAGIPRVVVIGKRPAAGASAVRS